MTATKVRSLLAASLLLVLLQPVAAAAANQVITVTEPADQARWGFTPSTVAIVLGDTVTFTNSGKVIHSFVANDNSFNSGVVNPGGVYAVRFGRPGQVPYICDIHPQMKGVIDV